MARPAGLNGCLEWINRQTVNATCNQPGTMKMNVSRHRAFTLIELLTVIGIIGVLAALLMPVGPILKNNAGRRRAQTEMHLLAAAVGQYHQDYGHFPVSRDAQAQAAENAKAGQNPDFTYGGTFATPSGTTLVGSSGLLLANSEVIAILMDFTSYPGISTATINVRHQMNSKGVRYLSAPMSLNTTSPGVGQDLVYRDPWGHPYVITLDLNYDGLCNDPVYDKQVVSQARPNSQHGFNQLFNKVDTNGSGDHFQLSGKVMVWSAGPDGKIDPTQPANTGVNKDNVLSWQ
jgi:prepilin-type N-terminal cleavage/methylation domain-containing protein